MSVLKKIFVWAMFLLTVAFVVAFFYQQAKFARQSAQFYRGNNLLLITKIKEAYHAQDIALARLQKIDEAAQNDRAQKKFDWYFDISQSHVVKRLQEK